MNFPPWLGLLAVCALVGANAFFVAAEFALVKVRATRVEQLVIEGNAVARILQQQTTQLDNYIAATQLGITLASLALGWIGEPSLAHLFEPLFDRIGATAIATDVADSVAIALSFAIITGFHIVLGELVPKSIALQRTERVSLFVAAPLLVFARVFRPFIVLMNGAGNAVVRLLGLSPTGEGGEIHSAEELELLVAQSGEAGALDPGEEVLLQHVFDFGDKRARDAMTPRDDIVALEEHTSLTDAARLCLSSGATRLPVYRGTLDQILGVAHAKDLLRLCLDEHEAPSGGGATEASEPPSAMPVAGPLAALARPATFVLEGSHLSDTLTTFRREGTHLALVVGEYGQIEGLLTLEDVLEELVGEIHDEYDSDEETPIVQQADGNWLVVGTESYEHVREVVGLPPIPPEERGQYATLAGLVMLRLGRVPQAGDHIQVGGGWDVEVSAMHGRRVSQLLLRRRAQDALAAEGDDGASHTVP
ncbi:MAG TPA: hemolysin family protein [Ktedonobacterales bacterium]|nr:hemolysin family protein [Ktedonobacterales bacterium]